MNPAIEIKNYSFRYFGADENVLAGCDFTLGFGEFVVLSGESGAGKSTLLSSIIGSIPNIQDGEASGDVMVGGRNVRGLRVSEIARMVGSVLQDADSQIVHARVEDEIAFGCENFNMDPQEIDERIGRVCTMMKLERTWTTQTLSGGQKQRLITAATLAMGQKILVFDEPLANLDREGALHLMETLKRLTREEGYAVLFVEHRLDMVRAFADRFVWLEGGKCRPREGTREHVGTVPLCCSARSDGTEPAEPSPSSRAPGRNRENRLPASCSASPCVDIRHLAFRVSGRDILRDVDFTVHKGERIVILGENGCGKTTLLRLIARLCKPTGGEIAQHIDPALGRKGTPRWFRKVGYVYQNPGYQLFMPQVSEEIRYGADSDADAGRFSELFGLDALAERHPHSLSEGQKRRLGIAAVAARNPDLLLLDEPTVGQDFDGLNRMIGTLNKLSRAHGCAMVTVTHDFRCASALADRAIWIQDGSVCRIGGQEVIDAYFATAPRKGEQVEQVF